MGRFSSIAKSVKATNSFKRSSKADSAASSAADVESNRLEETIVEPAHPAPRLGADVAPLRSLTDRTLGSAGHPDARLDLADLFRRRLDERWRRAEHCRIFGAGVGGSAGAQPATESAHATEACPRLRTGCGGAVGGGEAALERECAARGREHGAALRGQPAQAQGGAAC